MIRFGGCCYCAKMLYCKQATKRCEMYWLLSSLLLLLLYMFVVIGGLFTLLFLFLLLLLLLLFRNSSFQHVRSPSRDA